jgi:hypothetical protein
MTPGEVDLGTLVVEVGVAPREPGEFVIFRIHQKTLLGQPFGSAGSVTDSSRSHPSCWSTSRSMATSGPLASRRGSAWYSEGQQR